MENSEKYAQEAYRQTHLEDLQKIARDEEIHESRLIELIDEEGLNYMSSPDFVNVSPKNHLQIMGRYVDVVS